MRGIHLMQIGDAPCIPFAWGVYLADVVAWITAIPYSEWPQQHRVDHQLRPAMVNDPQWHGFGAKTGPLVASIMTFMPPGAEEYNRMLSVVMPGHSIEPHKDTQSPEWLTRVHVPLVAPPRDAPGAALVFGETAHWLEVGCAYLVDTRQEHYVVNHGGTARIHLMFDVRRR